MAEPKLALTLTSTSAMQLAASPETLASPIPAGEAAAKAWAREKELESRRASQEPHAAKAARRRGAMASEMSLSPPPSFSEPGIGVIEMELALEEMTMLIDGAFRFSK